MTSNSQNDIVVIGVGNPYQRDGGVGPAVAQRLSAQRLPGVRLAISNGEPAGLIELWEGARLAVVIDALHTEPATPGRIHRFCLSDYQQENFGEAIELAAILGRLPRRLVLFAVEAGDVGFGPGLTPAVAAAAGRIAADIANRIAPAA